MSETTLLAIAIVLLATAIVLLQAQIRLLNQRIDHIWEYSRILDRSLNAQHRLLTAICANLRIEPSMEETEDGR
jgi:hypothetical protein